MSQTPNYKQLINHLEENVHTYKLLNQQDYTSSLITEKKIEIVNFIVNKLLVRKWEKIKPTIHNEGFIHATILQNIYINPLRAESVSNFGIFLNFNFPKNTFKYSKSNSQDTSR